MEANAEVRLVLVQMLLPFFLLPRVITDASNLHVYIPAATESVLVCKPIQCLHVSVIDGTIKDSLSTSSTSSPTEWRSLSTAVTYIVTCVVFSQSFASYRESIIALYIRGLLVLDLGAFVVSKDDMNSC